MSDVKEFNIGDVVTTGYMTATIVAKYFNTDKDEHHTLLVESPKLSLRYTEEQCRQYFPKKENDNFAEYERGLFCAMNRYSLVYIHGFNVTSPDYKDLTVIGKQNLIEGKYNIGDKVVTNKTGPINIGTICGKTIGYKNNIALQNCKWDSLYPDWSMKPVYFIQLDGPNKAITWEEYFTAMIREVQSKINTLPVSLGISEEGIQAINDKIAADYDALPKTFIISAPEDDLSLVGDISELFEEELCKS